MQSELKGLQLQGSSVKARLEMNPRNWYRCLPTVKVMTVVTTQMMSNTTRFNSLNSFSMTFVFFFSYVAKCVLRKAKFLNIKKYQPSHYSFATPNNTIQRSKHLKGYILTNPTQAHWKYVSLHTFLQHRNNVPCSTFRGSFKVKCPESGAKTHV